MKYMNQIESGLRIIFCKCLILFVVGSFLGFLIETVFCRITAKKWMNRSTYLFWPMSSVWGGAFLLAGIFYEWLNICSVTVIFLTGVFFGSLYEYWYSVLLEKVFSVRFWDYSKFRYHIKGRVNLLYSIGWGMAAVVWTKGLYPMLEMGMNVMSSSMLLAVGAAMAVELSVDTAVTVVLLTRYSKRKAADHVICDKWHRIDQYFTDSYMEEVFPYMQYNRKP